MLIFGAMNQLNPQAFLGNHFELRRQPAVLNSLSMGTRFYQLLGSNGIEIEKE
jgi:hypothetical protein